MVFMDIYYKVSRVLLIFFWSEINNAMKCMIYDKLEVPDQFHQLTVVLMSFAFLQNVRKLLERYILTNQKIML